jgi:hypothetical protein
VTICLRCVSQPQNEYPFAVTTLLLQSYYHQLSFQQLSGYNTCMTYLHHLLKASMMSSCRCHVHGSRVFFILCCVPEIDGVKHALGHSEPHLLVAPLIRLGSLWPICLPKQKDHEIDQMWNMSKREGFAIFGLWWSVECYVQSSVWRVYHSPSEGDIEKPKTLAKLMCSWKSRAVTIVKYQCQGGRFWFFLYHQMSNRYLSNGYSVLYGAELIFL